MHPRSLVLLVFGVISTAIAFGQGDLRSRLRPITAPIRHAGVFHVATGTWTRGESLAAVARPDVVYNNSCVTGYSSSQEQGEKFQHRSCLPSPSHPTVPSPYYATGNDEAPGCRTNYTIEGFQFAYCRHSGQAPVDFRIEFSNVYADCAGADMVPTVSIDVTGLPGCVGSDCHLCWIVDVDLTGSGQAFVLQADGDGTYTGPITREQFGFSIGPTSAVTLSEGTGPILAGNYSWTGGPIVGAIAPCRGADGTIWDPPVILAEPGTGMASNSFFRATGNTSAPNGPGCYDFGPNVHADFYLKLYAAPTPGCPGNVMTSYCHPWSGSVLDCPCSNPPYGLPRGCDNSSDTGGAGLGASGAASLAADTVLLGTAFEKSSALSIVLQGTTAIAAGVVYGQGVRCVGGTLKRLYVKAALEGGIRAPEAGDLTVSARSAQLGDPIAAGESRYYAVYYRDPFVQGTCPPSSTFQHHAVGRDRVESVTSAEDEIHLFRSDEDRA